MTIFDRYVFGSFLQTLLLWFVTFSGIYVVFDLLTNLDSFFGGRENPFLVIFRYYSYKSFLFIDVILSLLILISAMTVILNMIRRNEIIALRAIGVSNIRIILPILIAAAGCSLLAFYFREGFLPNRIENLVKTPKELVQGDQSSTLKQTTDEATLFVFESGTAFPRENRIVRLKVTLPERFNLSGRTLTAESAVYRPASDDFPEGYLLKNVTPAEVLQGRSFDLDGVQRPEDANSPPDAAKTGQSSETGLPPENSETVAKGKTSTDSTGRPLVLLTPTDFPDRLAPDECFVASRVPIEFMTVGDAWKNYASIASLVRAAKNPSLSLDKKEIQVRIHSHLLRPLADLLPLLLGIPVLLLKNDRNPFKGMAIGSALAGLYIGLTYVAVYFGTKWNLPILGAWIPLLLFLPITVGALDELRRN